MDNANLTPKQQAVQAIRQAERVLIVSHHDPDGDAFGALLALVLAVKKMGKEVSAAVSGKIPKAYNFLEGFEIIKPKIEGTKDFVILLSENKAKVGKLSYKLEDERLKIVISPKTGNFSPQDVNFAHGDFHYDLIIVLDTDALKRLGDIYLDNAEMFFKTQVLNIDHHSANEFFGQINLIDDSASSVAEILVSLFEALEGSGAKLIDGKIATALLLGVMTDTNLFQNSLTSPKSLTVAAQLIAAGANRDLISKKVFQTHSYSTLKIWGTILSKLDSYPALGLVWSEVTKQDLNITGASEMALSQAINNLLFTTEGAKIVVLFSEFNGKIKVNLRSTENFDVAKVAEGFGGSGHQKAAGFELEGSLEEAKRLVLQKLKNLVEGEEQPLNSNHNS